MLSEEENDKISAMDNAITGLIRRLDNNDQIVDHNYEFLSSKLIELSENHSKIIRLVQETIESVTTWQRTHDDQAELSKITTAAKYKDRSRPE